jgi:transposase
MNITTITNQEIADLKALHRNADHRKEADRIKAIILAHDGYSGREIARILLIDEDTVTAWKRKFDESGSLADYLMDGYVPHRGKLNQAQTAEVFSFVEARIIPDAAIVSAFIQERFNKSYTDVGCARLLHRLGFSYKSTTLIPAKHDAKKQMEFVETYRQLAQNLRPDEAILFVDGVHPQRNTQVSQAWIKRGFQKLIKSNTGRKRLNINGAYNPFTSEVIVHEDITINAQTTIRFFEKVERQYADKRTIYAIVDNATYYRNKNVKEYLKDSRVTLIFLPPYSPNLNLIERLWKFMRKKLLKSWYYETFKAFKSAVLNFFAGIVKYADELRQFIGTEFHLLPI